MLSRSLQVESGWDKLVSAVAIDPSLHAFCIAHRAVWRCAHQQIATLEDSLREPRGLAAGAGGELFVADPRRRAVQLFGPRGERRFELRLERYTPTDVAVVGDTLWVLSTEPAALLRAHVVRGD